MGKKWANKLAAARLALTLALATLAVACAPDGPPPLPQVYSGSVSVAGSPSPDGLRLAAAVDGYETAAVQVERGGYAGLTVAPASSRHQGKRVRFFLLTPQGRVVAEQEAVFQTGRTPEVRRLDLSFPPLSEAVASSAEGGGAPPLWLVGGVLAAVVVLGALGLLQRLARRGRRDRWGGV